MPKNVLLLDADQIAYRSAFAVERVHDWGDDTLSKVCDKAELRRAVDLLVEQAMNDTGLDLVIFGHSGPNNFRKEILTDYKGNRDPRKRPIGLKEALAYIETTWPALCHPRLEADDILGVYASKWKTSVLWANDKDFLTVPCRLFQKGVLHEISEADADKALMIQTLTGDSTDNYRGIEGVGPKKAEKWLDTHGYTWEAVHNAYLEHGYSFDYFIRTAKVARICRKVSDWNRWFPLRYSQRELALNATSEF